MRQLPSSKVGTRCVRRQATDLPGRRPPGPPPPPHARLLPLHHQRAGERVRLDHALSLSEARLQPAAGHSVLAPGGPLDHQIQLVAQLPAVRGVAQLERALRVQGQPDVARHRLRAQMAILSADPGPGHRPLNDGSTRSPKANSAMSSAATSVTVTETCRLSLATTSMSPAWARTWKVTGPLTGRVAVPRPLACAVASRSSNSWSSSPRCM